MGSCICGHAVEEHGGDKTYPGSTACQVCGDDCVAYEDSGDDEEDA